MGKGRAVAIWWQITVGTRRLLNKRGAGFRTVLTLQHRFAWLAQVDLSLLVRLNFVEKVGQATARAQTPFSELESAFCRRARFLGRALARRATFHQRPHYLASVGARMTRLLAWFLQASELYRENL